MKADGEEVERSNGEGHHLDEIAVSIAEVVSLAEVSQVCASKLTNKKQPLVTFKTSVIRAATALKEVDFKEFNRRSTLFTFAETENSKLFEVSDEVVDPLVWTGTMGWRWYSGFIIYILTTITAPIMGFIFFNIIQIRSTDQFPSNWWKCGVFCAFIWSFVLNAFTFEIIRKKVRANPIYADFDPSWIRMIVSWLVVGVLMFSFWVFLYMIDHKLMWMHGTWAAFIGLLSGPAFQCLWIRPETFTRKWTKDLLLITLATSVLFIPIQALSLSFCLVLYNKFKKDILILLFYVVRMAMDYLVEIVCKHGDALSFRIIFININALMNRLLLCYTLASADQKTVGIIITVGIDFMFVLGLALLITGPLAIHTDPYKIPQRLYNWIRGKSYDEAQLTKKETKQAIGERAKWVYFTVLHATGEVIMPWWQMFFYYLLYSTPSRSALAGFERSINGFHLIDRVDLLKTAVIMGTFDILDLMMFSYIVRRKFKQFTPWRLLNVMVKKYNLLLALSVMSVVISIQCILLIDCRFIFTVSAVEDFFTGNN